MKCIKACHCTCEPTSLVACIGERAHKHLDPRNESLGKTEPTQDIGRPGNPLLKVRKRKRFRIIIWISRKHWPLRPLIQLNSDVSEAASATRHL